MSACQHLACEHSARESTRAICSVRMLWLLILSNKSLWRPRLALDGACSDVWQERVLSTFPATHSLHIMSYLVNAVALSIIVSLPYVFMCQQLKLLDNVLAVDSTAIGTQ